jgi:hypothetical protein
LISGKEDAANNFARGHYTSKCTLRNSERGIMLTCKPVVLNF